MSARMTGLVFSRYPNGGGEFVLALALADHAWDDGTRIWPSVKTLASKTRQSPRAVQYQLRNMLDSGWLQLVKKASGKPKFCNEYRINPEWIAGADIAPVELGSQKCSTENAAASEDEIPSGEQESYPQTGANVAPLTGADIAPVDVETGANDDERGAKLLHPTHHITHHKKNIVVDDNACANSGESYPQTEPFPMPLDWMPSSDFFSQRMAGIVPHELLTLMRVREFASYWNCRFDVQQTQAGWEHKLLQRLYKIQMRLDIQHGAAVADLTGDMPESLARVLIADELDAHE